MKNQQIKAPTQEQRKKFFRERDLIYAVGIDRELTETDRKIIGQFSLTSESPLHQEQLKKLELMRLGPGRLAAFGEE